MYKMFQNVTLIPCVFLFSLTAQRNLYIDRLHNLKQGGALLHCLRGHQAATISSASVTAGLVFCSCLHCQLLSVGNKVYSVREPGSECY